MNSTTVKLFIGITFLIIFSIIGWQEVMKQGANWLPIKYVRIEGTFQYIEKNKIKQVLKGQVNNGLYNANIKNIQQSVADLPWVNSVKVKRVWPDAIEIKITEQVPIAKWYSTELVNKNGDIFKPDNLNNFEHLPMIAGNTGNEKKLLETMADLTIDLKEHNMKLTEFQVSNRRAWTIKIQNGMELILGRNEPFKNLQRFLKTRHLLGKEQLAKIKVVDLRYPNGYALAWKSTEEKIDWKLLADKNQHIAE
ncbi:MAG: cell division protein FtsQ/DivIB [Methylococcaceae bacterium]|nr:cell division protein FtsQ/DivIB [Methylococcaceae bacterium]